MCMQRLNLHHQILAYFNVSNGISSSVKIAVAMEINVNRSRRPPEYLPQYGSPISERHFLCVHCFDSAISSCTPEDKSPR